MYGLRVVTKIELNEDHDVGDAPRFEAAFIGRELRALRHRKGLGLAQVAEATDISKSFLSLVEVGKSDITFSRLMRLVSFYGISITDLVPGQGDAGLVSVLRSGDQKVMAFPAEGIRDVVLTPDTKRTMLPILAEFEPGAKNVEPSVHDGEEFVYVLEGSIVVHFDGAESITLEQGDCLYFAAELPHTYDNPARKPSRLLLVVSPPHI
jgi:quercetin dioxygenase-like cupin family protein/DNA-binding Xre family transcriptional regulator